MKTLRRETCLMKTVLMRWRTTVSWWTEMYVSTQVFYIPFFPQRQSLCLADYSLLVSHVLDGYGSCLTSAVVTQWSPVSAVCFFLSVWLFILMSCSFLPLSLLLFNSCLLLSKWKVLYKKLILNHFRNLTHSSAKFPELPGKFAVTSQRGIEHSMLIYKCLWGFETSRRPPEG